MHTKITPKHSPKLEMASHPSQSPSIYAYHNPQAKTLSNEQVNRCSEHWIIYRLSKACTKSYGDSTKPRFPIVRKAYARIFSTG
jgi:hypothetical protein